MPVVFGADDVLFGPDHVIFGPGDESEAGPPTSPGTSALLLEWDGVEVGALGWRVEFNEILGAASGAVFVVQDRLNSDWEPKSHHDVKASIRSSGWVVFHGESMQPECELPVGKPFREWIIPAKDYSGWVREALFGAPDGGNFWRPNARENYRPVDPNAVSTGTDRDTIQAWGEHYRPTIPNGTEIDYDTHVHDNGSPIQPIDDQDAMSNLGAAIAKLASLLEVNVQDTLCPDLHWHHVHVPSAVQLLADGDIGDLEEAPVEIGPGGQGHMGLRFAWDGADMPQQVYGQGQTGFTHEDGFEDAAGASGWYPVDPDLPNVPVGQNALLRQAYLPMPSAWSRAQAIRIATSALDRATDEALRASFVVEGVDGWRAGQVVTINDARLPPSMQGSHKFVIQRVHGVFEAGTDRRRYDIDIGDGASDPSLTGSGAHVDANAPAEKAPPKPSIALVVDTFDADGHPDTNPIGPDEERFCVASTINVPGLHHEPQGLEVTFTVVAIDFDPDSPTFGTIIPDQGTFDPQPATSDQDGKARSKFTASSMTGLAYQLGAKTPLPQV